MRHNCHDILLSLILILGPLILGPADCTARGVGHDFGDVWHRGQIFSGLPEPFYGLPAAAGCFGACPAGGGGVDDGICGSHRPHRGRYQL